ncbi:MAG: hypothetical protein JXR58_01055 [Bacteroidales bacterium]|nr:hypothetical protein [Bacteroidales bacterium]
MQEKELIKEKLWEKFCDEYLDNFAEFGNIYNELINSLHNLKRFEIDTLFAKNEIPKEHSEWLYLLSQLSNDNDKSFFKQYWVRINPFSLFQFVDISSKNFELFSVVYKPSSLKWQKLIYVTDIDNLLKADVNGLEIEKILHQQNNLMIFGNIHGIDHLLNRKNNNLR